MLGLAKDDDTDNCLARVASTVTPANITYLLKSNFVRVSDKNASVISLLGWFTKQLTNQAQTTGEEPQMFDINV